MLMRLSLFCSLLFYVFRYSLLFLHISVSACFLIRFSSRHIVYGFVHGAALGIFTVRIETIRVGLIRLVFYEPHYAVCGHRCISPLFAKCFYCYSFLVNQDVFNEYGGEKPNFLRALYRNIGGMSKKPEI